MATQPDQMRHALGPLVDTARLSLPHMLSQADFFWMCQTRYGLLSKLDAFKLHLRGKTSTPAEDFAVMCKVMNDLLEDAGLEATLPDIPIPNGRPGTVVPLTKSDARTTDRARSVSLKVA